MVFDLWYYFREIFCYLILGLNIDNWWCLDIEIWGNLINVNFLFLRNGRNFEYERYW